MNLSNEAKVAITIIAALIAAFFGYRFMNDIPVFRQSQKVYTYFERVDGLTPGSYIYLNGVKVGSVDKIALENADSVEVALNFNLGVSVPRNSVAYLESSGLLNEKAIIIERGDAPQNISYADTLEGVYRKSITETLKNEGAKLSDDFSQSFDKLNTLLERLNSVTSEANQGNLSSMLSDVKSISGEILDLLQEKRTDLESSFDHANRFLANLDTLSTTNKDRVDSTLAGLERSLNELETLSAELNKTSVTLNSILEKIDRGEGSMGQLMNNPSLYNNLDSLSTEMKVLIRNINENPREYLKHMRLIEVF